MPERVSTFTISGQFMESNSTDSTMSFSTLFVPPAPISGESCYLKIFSAMLDQDIEASDLVGETWLIRTSWFQPNSFASIYDEVGGSLGTRRSAAIRSPNSVVAVLHKSANTIQAQPENSRCLVQIPEGPHELTITAQRVEKDGNTYTTYPWGLTLFGEITPISSL